MIDDRLDRDIETGATARPRYSTDVIRTDGGFEVRNQRWTYPLFEFEFNLEPGDRDGDADALQDFIDLWHAAAGQYDKFRFRDWGDYSVVDHGIATADGITSAFQLYRVYQRGAVTRLRKITRPVQDTVSAKVGSTPTAVTVDYDTGIITFGSPPAAGQGIYATFEFDLPVRFADDQLELVALMKDLDKPVNISLLEVRE